MIGTDIFIIGGGAGGLAAAIQAKRTNKNAGVFVAEHLPKVGKKILATGNGRCNLGNLNAAEHPYRNAEFARAALQKYDTDSLISFFESMGLFTRADGEGRLYPQSNTAASVLDALRFEARNLGVEIGCDLHIDKIKPSNGGFIINDKFFAKKIIIACGGKAAPSQGSDGSGYSLLKQLCHGITPLAPSLVQLTTDTAKTRSLKGVRATAELTLSTGGSSRGEVLFTDYGLSGIASMDLSRFVLPNRKATVTLNLLGQGSAEKCEKMLCELIRHNPKLPAENLLSGLVPKALGIVVMKSALGFMPKTAGEISAREVEKIVRVLSEFKLELKGTKGFPEAQVTRGGADTGEFDSQTMQSKKQSGLYACGEVLDVDGACGGFNLAWAFASGRLAGECAARSIE